MIKENGPAENLTYETDVATPKVADGQVLVKNEFTGINFIDTYFRKGGPAYTQALPFISGQEGGGVIVECTPKAAEAGLAVGQRVAYSVLGTYCEYTAVPAAKIVNVPDGVGLDTATACMTQGLTAHYLTHDAHAQLIQPGTAALFLFPEPIAHQSSASLNICLPAPLSPLLSVSSLKKLKGDLSDKTTLARSRQSVIV